jgi:hypothetical protein
MHIPSRPYHTYISYQKDRIYGIHSRHQPQMGFLGDRYGRGNPLKVKALSRDIPARGDIPGSTPRGGKECPPTAVGGLSLAHNPQ